MRTLPSAPNGLSTSYEPRRARVLARQLLSLVFESFRVMPTTAFCSLCSRVFFNISDPFCSMILLLLWADRELGWEPLYFEILLIRFTLDNFGEARMMDRGDLVKRGFRNRNP